MIIRFSCGRHAGPSVMLREPHRDMGGDPPGSKHDEYHSDMWKEYRQYYGKND
jgi:hypothetical protein